MLENRLLSPFDPYTPKLPLLLHPYIKNNLKYEISPIKTMVMIRHIKIRG